jgi:hypothetical protein
MHVLGPYNGHALCPLQAQHFHNTQTQSSLSFNGEFAQNPYLKKYSFNLYEGFSIKKNGPNSPNFEKNLKPISRFLLLVPVSSQKYRKIFIFFLLPY